MGKRTITLKVNNGGLMNIMQEEIDGKINVKEISRNMKYQTIADIPAGDMVMLINYYRYIKDNDIQCDFINYNGKNKR